jgi:hypothetical protein
VSKDAEVLVYQDDALCFITFDEEHHRVALLTPPVPLERKTSITAAAHHVAYTFDDLDDLLARYELLRDKDIQPAVCITHGVTTSMEDLAVDEDSGRILNRTLQSGRLLGVLCHASAACWSSSSASSTSSTPATA